MPTIVTGRTKNRFCTIKRPTRFCVTTCVVHETKPFRVIVRSFYVLSYDLISLHKTSVRFSTRLPRSCNTHPNILVRSIWNSDTDRNEIESINKSSSVPARSLAVVLTTIPILLDSTGTSRCKKINYLTPSGE